MEALEQSCLLVPEIAEVHNFHGEVLMSLNRRNEALVSFDEALHVDGTCSLPLLNKGVMRLSSENGDQPTQEDLAKAIELFDRAVEVDPSNDMAFIHRASYYCQVGDLKTALDNYDEAIRLTRSLPSLTDYLGFRILCAADYSLQQKLLKLSKQ